VFRLFNRLQSKFSRKLHFSANTSGT